MWLLSWEFEDTFGEKSSNQAAQLMTSYLSQKSHKYICGEKYKYICHKNPTKIFVEKIQISGFSTTSPPSSKLTETKQPL